MNVKMKGVVEYKLRNTVTGEVVREGREENLFTFAGRRGYFNGQSNPGNTDFPTRMYIANDVRDVEEKGISFLRTDPVANINDTIVTIGSPGTGWNRNTLTRVISVAFIAPTGGNRTTTHIGWQNQRGVGAPGANNMMQFPLTALKIDPPIVQLQNIESLEVTYTITMILPKSLTGLARLKQLGDGAALRRLRYRYIDSAPSPVISLAPYTLPRYWFLDDLNFVRGGASDPNGGWFNGDWNALGIGNIASYPGLATRGGTIATTVATGNGTVPGSRNGAFGMAVISDQAVTNPSAWWSTADENSTRQQEAWSFWPLCFEEGVVGPDVFPQPARSLQVGGSNNYMFNQTGVDKTGLGELEIQGPYIPTTVGTGAPAHWAYRVMNTKAGSVVGAGTEGGYIFQRKSWFAYPWAPQPDVGEVPPAPNAGGVDRVQSDSSWGMSGLELQMNVAERFDVTQGTDDPRLAHRMVYDGIDTFWGIAWRDGDGGGGGHTMVRWRGFTPESMSKGVSHPFTGPIGYTGDDAQSTLRFVDQLGVQIGFSDAFPYAFTTDGAGLVFYGHRNANNVPANNPMFRIDNTQPGRWHQRPSGSSDGVDTDRFVVDAADGVHGMFPFVGGDVGKRLVIADGPNAGVYQVAVFVDANNVDLFQSDGVTPAVLAADTETKWHWCTVTKLTNLLVGDLRHLAYDQANGRLWAMGELGLQVSVDDGTTWSALVDEGVGSVPQFPDAEPHEAVQVGESTTFTQSPFAIDANGDFYWLSNGTIGGYWLNKLSWGTTGPGGDATFSRLALTASFPGANKPAALSQLVFEIGCDNANGLGAIWIYSDLSTSGTTSFYRLTVVAGALSAVNITQFDPTTFTKLVRHPRWIMSTPGGMSVLAVNNGTARYFWVPRALGTLDDAFFDMGAAVNPIFHLTGTGWGQTAFRPDGTFLAMADGFNPSNSASGGVFGSFWNNYFWDDSGPGVWVPWEGSGAQFDAFHGTTNLGVKVPHTAFEELLDNVQVKFSPIGGADTDQFKEGESFVFLATFGPHRTNVEDFSVTSYHSEMGGAYLVESEAVKVASPNTRPVQVYWYTATANPTPGTFRNVTGDSPLQGAGKMYGWEPNRFTSMLGQGDAPNTLSSSFQNYEFQATIDLGALPPEIGKLRLMFDRSGSAGDEFFENFAPGSANYLWFGASDDGTFTDGVFTGAINEYDVPNARWDNLNSNFPNGYSLESGAAYQTNAFRGWMLEVDLVKLGMSAGERTHRYWQINSKHIFSNAFVQMFYMEAQDPSGNRIGVDANHRVDEAEDVDFAGALIDEAVWIQDAPGDAPNNPTTVSTAGTASGKTDFVTVDAGTFNTAEIDIVTDYLAWAEPGNPGPGFLRDFGNRSSDLLRGKSGVVNDTDDTPSLQAMSKIVAVTANTITVRDSIIPDNLVNASWEVRRPIYDGTDYSGRPSQGPCTVPNATNPNSMGYDPYEGYVNQQFANESAGRRFRITRKSVFRIE